MGPTGQDALIAAIALGRVGTPTDIASIVAYCASPEAEYITGQVISVDGGLSMFGYPGLMIDPSRSVLNKRRDASC